MRFEHCAQDGQAALIVIACHKACLERVRNVSVSTPGSQGFLSQITVECDRCIFGNANRGFLSLQSNANIVPLLYLASGVLGDGTDASPKQCMLSRSKHSAKAALVSACHKQITATRHGPSCSTPSLRSLGGDQGFLSQRARSKNKLKH